MVTRSSDPVQRLADRQRRLAAFLEARRDQIEPLRRERTACVEALEEAQRQFMATAMPSLGEDSLAPFDKAATAAMSDFSPRQLAQRLRAQSEKASKQCQRYEREQGIYDMANQLPDLEAQVATSVQKLEETRRELDRLEVLLEPLAEFNRQRSEQGQPPVTLENAESFTRARGLTHHVRRLTNAGYRQLCQVLMPIEQDGLTLRQQLWRRAQLQTDSLVREQEADTLQQTLTRQRGWVDSYVQAWTSRLTERQLLTAVQEATADQFSDPLFRRSLADSFGRRWPAAIDTLYARIATIDSQTARFHAAFDAHYDTGRIVIDDEMSGRRRTPGSVGA